jgi:phosphatidylglycerol:prolipoprotein diacylglycerol transferase
MQSLISIKPYGWLMLAAIVLSLCFWVRLAKRDGKLLMVYVAALVGAFLGAKVVYILAEGWRDFAMPDAWLRLATGKSILGALLGGYAAVEAAKRFFGYKGVTGDWFATVVPAAVMLGRVGCWIHGCCLGRVCPTGAWGWKQTDGLVRWPAAQVELAFNAVMVLTFLVLRGKKAQAGQHFHIYLMCYGIFRFAHEFLRDTPVLIGGLSGYQITALTVFLLGLSRFQQRARGLHDSEAPLINPSRSEVLQRSLD